MRLAGYWLLTKQVILLRPLWATKIARDPGAARIEDIARKACLVFGKVFRTKAGKEPMGYVSFRSEAYISLGMVKTRSYFLIGPDSWPSWLWSPLSSRPTRWLILSDISTPLSAFLHHSCVLLFYDHTITIFTIPMTHILSYLSLTLPGLSLDSHSFDYSFLSRLCSFLLSPPHSLCNPSIFIYDVLSSELFSVMATLVYIV